MLHTVDLIIYSIFQFLFNYMVKVAILILIYLSPGHQTRPERNILISKHVYKNVWIYNICYAVCYVDPYCANKTFCVTLINFLPLIKRVTPFLIKRKLFLERVRGIYIKRSVKNTTTYIDSSRSIPMFTSLIAYH